MNLINLLAVNQQLHIALFIVFIAMLASATTTAVAILLFTHRVLRHKKVDEVQVDEVQVHEVQVQVANTGTQVCMDPRIGEVGKLS